MTKSAFEGSAAPASADVSRMASAEASRRLVVASMLMLLVELALIRWLGSNVLHLSYFSNFVLLGSFLGIGLGLLVSKSQRRFLPWSPVALATLVAIVHVFPVKIDRASDQIIYFTSLSPSGPPPWLALPVVFLAVAAVLVGPAEAVGRCFGQLPPLDAYRLDLIGSLIGITVFTALSFLHAPSVVWGAVVAALYVWLLWARLPVAAAVALVVMLTVLTLESLTAGVSWSPYYKVTTTEKYSADGDVDTEISVNGIPHQVVRAADRRTTKEPQYALPYERLPDNRLGDVLIVGAGSGSDVAIALQRGAEHVDAVDIDPRIVQIGRERHPDRPYSDSRVTTHINDGRAFLEQADKRYDLILFALPDSLALVTGGSSIRLESYLFTEEALETARDRLKPGGAFGMYNYYREEWLIERLAATAQAAFGHPPCVDRVGSGGGQAVVVVALAESDQRCGGPVEEVVSLEGPVSDDRPFLYFRGGMLPALYVVTLGVLLLVSAVAVRAAAGPLRAMRPYLDLFFLGAAFLLLETKNISSFALLFGTTWTVNAVVFGGVLVAVLLAVETTRRFRTPSLPVLYASVAASLALAYVLPNSVLLDLSLVPRLLVATATAFLPLFLANLAFAKRFSTTDDAPSALGVNLLGAMLGGSLEYLALLTGYRNLLVIVGLLYLCAFCLTPRRAQKMA